MTAGAGLGTAGMLADNRWSSSTQDAHGGSNDCTNWRYGNVSTATVSSGVAGEKQTGRWKCEW